MYTCSLDLQLLQWLIAHIQEFILVFMKTMLFCLVLYHSNPIHHHIVNIGIWKSRYLSEIDNKPICHLNTILLLWHFPLKMLTIHSCSIKYGAVVSAQLTHNVTTTLHLSCGKVVSYTTFTQRYWDVVSLYDVVTT